MSLVCLRYKIKRKIMNATNSAETERLFARNFARLARKFDRSTKLELEIARKNLARKRLELDIARKRFCSNSLARNMPCSFLLGFARYLKYYK